MATSDSIETGGPAFPLPFPHKQVRYVPMRDGMTLRDYFAAKALCGMLSNPNYPDGSFWIQLAEDAYDVADAMLKARGEDRSHEGK